jgi:hypothetical protein
VPFLDEGVGTLNPASATASGSRTDSSAPAHSFSVLVRGFLLVTFVLSLFDCLRQLRRVVVCWRQLAKFV